MIQLRPFQSRLAQGIQDAWANGARVVYCVLPTGGGKTVIFSKFIREHRGASCIIVHRAELVAQASVTLARNGVWHRIIGPRELQRVCAALHMREVGKLFHDPRAQAAVAGVDTLIRRGEHLAKWLPTVTLVVQDEGHHVLRDNKWGKAFEMFPNARGLFVTATPLRADGNGLGRHAHGYGDVMVVGPTGRELIDEGFLTDYRIIAPPTDIDYSHVPISASGEFSMPALRSVVHESNTIVGDVVRHYKKFAEGELGITFAVDVQSASELAAAYRDAGVPAECVSADTPDEIRFAVLRKFRNRQLLQLVNVDLFGEGFDLPAVTCVSMVRRTESYGLYCQQFGRALRVMVDDDQWGQRTAAERRAAIAASGKPKAIIIDHVGNVARHGLPDVGRAWTLDAREKRSRTVDPDVIALRTCTNPECLAVFERFRTTCPYCGQTPTVGSRSSPDQVEGDLTELDPTALRALRGEIDRVVAPVVIPWGMPAAAAGGLRKAHAARADAQRALREAIALWAGWQRHMGYTDAEGYRRFWLTYGTDVGTAQTLGAREADELRERIERELNLKHVRAA